MKISGNEIINHFNNGGKYIADVALKTHGEKLNEIGKEAFEEAIEIGIFNTIASLYDANIKD